MSLKRIHILFLILLPLAGCKKENNTTLPRQQDQFVSFLTTTHNPKLVSVDVADESIDRPLFFTEQGETAYRYIRDYYNPSRAERTQVERGDRVALTYWIYDFSGQEILHRNIDPGAKEPHPDFEKVHPTAPFYTNDPWFENRIDDLDTSYWSFEPLEVRVGAGEVLKGVDVSLAGCREGDFVEIYMTYNMAYGGSPVGLIPAKTPIVFFCTIDNVQKQ